jgi:hypothetical protein
MERFVIVQRWWQEIDDTTFGSSINRIQELAR